MSKEILEFITKTGWIEETSGKRKFWIEMDTGIREFEKKMLSSGECLHSLSMHFLSEDHSLKAFYDFTGYMQLKDWLIIKMKKPDAERDSHMVIALLQILSGVLECIKGMENYLILPDRITLHPDAVFIDLNNDRVVLAFYPAESPETLQIRIVRLIHDLSGLQHSDETEQHLKKIEEFILAKNPGLDGMISFLGSIQREVSYIYWNTKNFRRIEEQDACPAHLQTDIKRNRFGFNLKTALIQIFLTIGLVVVFLSDKLDKINFTGFVIIVAAIDLMACRKHLTKKKI